MHRFRSPGRLVLATLALVAILATLAGPASAHSRRDRHRDDDHHREVADYTITITNLTGGQYLTPPNWAAHSRRADVFQVRRPASNGLQQLAENGAVPVLAAELQASIDAAGLGVSGVAGPPVPIAPGESRTWTITTDERRLSVLAMLVCTNDGFAGLDAKRLPRHEGKTRTYRLKAYDAGTEINTELRQDLVTAPVCGGVGGSDQTNPALAENGVVRRHRTIQGVGDLGPEFDWRGPVARLEITRN